MEEDGQQFLNQINSLPKKRQIGHSQLAKAMSSCVRNDVKAKTLALTIEDLIFKLYGKMDNDYMESVKALATELAKQTTSEADILKLSQSKLSDLDIFVSTLKKPSYFEL